METWTEDEIIKQLMNSAWIILYPEWEYRDAGSELEIEEVSDGNVDGVQLPYGSNVWVFQDNHGRHGSDCAGNNTEDNGLCIRIQLE